MSFINSRPQLLSCHKTKWILSIIKENNRDDKLPNFEFYTRDNFNNERFRNFTHLSK